MEGKKLNPNELYRQKVQKEISDILEVVQKVTRGDYSSRIKLKPKEDEFSKLTMAINLMASALEDKCEENTLNNKRQQTSQKEIQRLSTIIEATSDFVAIANTEGGVLYINQGGRKMVGLKPNEDLSKYKISNFYPEKEQDKILNIALPTALKNGVWEDETIFLDFSKKEISVSEVIIYHHEASKAECFFATIVRDIRIQKKFETELKAKIEETEKFNKLMVGRELKMVELKNEIKQLKMDGQHPQAPETIQVDLGGELK